MIIKGLFELVFVLLKIVFAPINLPDLPLVIQNVLDRLLEAMISGMGLLSVFVDLDVLMILIPVVIVVVNLDRVWGLIMFVLRKIPFLGIK